MDTYTHGHADPVLQSHRWRTVENSAGYLLPHLRPGLDVLDVGCGPGTITGRMRLLNLRFFEVDMLVHDRVVLAE